MANNMRLSQRYLLSVAQKLKNEGFIKVEFGPDGGYSLAKPLGEISMFDIIMLMEGTLIISRCLMQENHCEEKPCVLHDAYIYLQDCIECYLRNLTIDMLVNQPMNTWQKTIIGKLDELRDQYQT